MGEKTFQTGSTVRCHGHTWSVVSVHKKGKRICCSKDGGATIQYKRADECKPVAA